MALGVVGIDTLSHLLERCTSLPSGFLGRVDAVLTDREADRLALDPAFREIGLGIGPNPESESRKVRVPIELLSRLREGDLVYHTLREFLFFHCLLKVPAY